MTYRSEYRDRELRLPLSMVRANESEKEKIEGMLAVIHGELATHIREILIAAADFFTSEDIRWFLNERNVHGVNRLVVFKEALAKYRQDISAARQMIQAAELEYAKSGSTERMPAKVAMG